ncbi:hypothetical protein AN958_04296 [Leucoagaricus sp. SymC.cos]|nr:hypothetical protein AN958_04296 [Leucoagaricus sp. SymC.cos]
MLLYLSDYTSSRQCKVKRRKLNIEYLNIGCPVALCRLHYNSSSLSPDEHAAPGYDMKLIDRCTGCALDATWAVIAFSMSPHSFIDSLKHWFKHRSSTCTRRNPEYRQSSPGFEGNETGRTPGLTSGLFSNAEKFTLNNPVIVENMFLHGNTAGFSIVSASRVLYNTRGHSRFQH